MNFITYLQHISSGQLRLLAVSTSILLSEIVVAFIELLLRGTVTADYLFTALLASAFVSYVVLTIMGSLVDKLTESQLQLHTIIEAAPECIKLLSADARLLQMNKAGLAMLEADTPEQVIGHHVHSMILPFYRQSLQSLIARVFAGESGDLEFEIQGIKGTHRWLHSHIVPLRNPRGKIIAALALTRDTTEKKRVEEALRIAHEHSELLLNSMAEGVYGVDTNGNCTFVNRSFLKMLGYSDTNEIIGKHIHEIIHHSHADGSHYPYQSCRMYQAYLAGEELNVSDEVFWHKNGTPIPVEYWAHPLLSDNKIIGSIATFVDIRERKAAERQIRQLAYYDVLTQLPNRRLLIDRLEQAMATSHRSQRYAALMFLDLDNFKPLNDKYGHDVGDLLLIEVANRISSCTRQMDTVARFGGDEFIVMIRELDTDQATSKIQAQIVAEKIRFALSEEYALVLQIANDQITKINHRCTASIGVVLFADRCTSQEDLMKWADSAMYRAKMNGGNNVLFYEDYF